MMKAVALSALAALAACSVQPIASPDTAPLTAPRPTKGGARGAPAQAVVAAPVQDATPGVTWPNADSRANSDAWLAQHHDAIRSMHPRVLVLNFSNAPDAMPTLKTHVDQIIAGLAEGSRYHGYASPDAQPFLQYEVAKIVDLADVSPQVIGWTHLNSSHYPRKCSKTSWYQFDYSALLDDEFASLIGMGKPLGELVANGDVHEVWLNVNGNPDPLDCGNGVHMNDFQLPEAIELKPKYDADGHRLDGQFEPCAGNGCMDASDVPHFQALNRSLRMVYINSTRGPGCAIHSLGHSFEGMANTRAISYLVDRANFKHFGNFDLREAHQTQFASWYEACATDAQSCIAYGNDTATVTTSAGAVTLDPLAQGCGNVHFAPNSRHNYDDRNTDAVLATCEHFGLHDGPGGKDLATPYTAAAHASYDSLVSDCEGGWQVYWRQSFPGVDNRAQDTTGGAMKNWWPFLFY